MSNSQEEAAVPSERDRHSLLSSSARTEHRVCTLQYRGARQTADESGQLDVESRRQQHHQQKQQQRKESAMPSNREMPPYEEWKRRRANRPFGQDVVLLELDPKEELARRKARDQRLMSLLNADEQDKFYTYLDHHERVQAKVQHDREAREREKAEAAQLALAQAEEKKRNRGGGSGHRLRKRLDRIALTTDSKFVSDVAKSKYYRLVQQEQKQQFQSREELDKFWLGRLASEGLLRRARSGGAGGGASGVDFDADDLEVAAAAAHGGDNGGGELVWEKTEDALQLGGGGGGGGGGRGNFHSMSRAQQSRLLEELFPRAERPKLTSFNVDYSRKKEKSADQLELERLQERRRHRLEEWRDHRHMQQMAVTFGVATRRILDERPVRESADRLMDEADSDLRQVFGEALERARRRQESRVAAVTAGGTGELDLTDPRLLQSWRKPPPEFRRQRRGHHQRGGDDSSSGGFSSAAKGAAERPLTTPATEGHDGDSETASQSGGVRDGRRRPGQQLLSLHDAHRQLPQVEAKGQSTLWNNYLSAGNVRFAPLDDDQWYRLKTSGTADEARTTVAAATTAAAAAT